MTISWRRFIQKLNQPPRSARHGYRKPSPTTHGRPADGAGDGPERATVSWRSIHDPKARDHDASTIAGTGPGPVTPLEYGHTIPYAGIRAGEIIAHRLWWVMFVPRADRMMLASIAHPRIWFADEPMEGDIAQIIGYSINVRRYLRGGVYAFSDLASIRRDFANLAYAFTTYQRMKTVGRGESWLNGAGIGADAWCGVRSAVGLVAGTVKLWGDVVEHEHGYRAQFAKPHSISRQSVFIGDTHAALVSLSDLYGVRIVSDTDYRRDHEF